MFELCEKTFRTREKQQFTPQWQFQWLLEEQLLDIGKIWSVHFDLLDNRNNIDMTLYYRKLLAYEWHMPKVW